MKISILQTKEKLGDTAASHGAALIREAIRSNGRVNIILATGASQFEMLDHLVRAEGIDWTQVTVFHLDEYIGIGVFHPASFRKYLKERFVDRLPTSLAAFYGIDGEKNPQAQCETIGRQLLDHPIDVAFIGIGENGHLAFNDPPADFETDEPYLVVTLDEECRRQQLGEGWFAALDDVPREAISMSVRRIMASRSIVCSVPDARKAVAVQGAVAGAVTPDVPASILQQHSDAALFLDCESAALLPQLPPRS